MRLYPPGFQIRAIYRAAVPSVRIIADYSNGTYLVMTEEDHNYFVTSAGLLFVTKEEGELYLALSDLYLPDLYSLG